MISCIIFKLFRHIIAGFGSPYSSGSKRGGCNTAAAAAAAQVLQLLHATYIVSHRCCRNPSLPPSLPPSIPPSRGRIARRAFAVSYDESAEKYVACARA